MPDARLATSGILAEARGDEAGIDTAGGGPYSAIDAAAGDGGALVTARAGGPMLGVLDRTLRFDLPAGRNYRSVSWIGSYGTQTWVGGYFRVTQALPATEVWLLRLTNASSQYVQLMADVAVSGCLRLRQPNSDPTDITSTHPVPKIGEVTLYELRAWWHTSSTIVEVWVARPHEQPVRVVNSSFSRAGSSTTGRAVLGPSFTASGSWPAYGMEIAGGYVANARRGHLEIERSRPNRKLINSTLTGWRPSDRVRGTGVLVPG